MVLSEGYLLWVFRVFLCDILALFIALVCLDLFHLVYHDRCGVETVNQNTKLHLITLWQLVYL